MINDTTDSELLMLINEKNEDAEKILYERYLNNINSIINKYSFIMKSFNIDYSEIYSECLKRFTSAIESYNDKSSITFKTYSYILIERGIKNIILFYQRSKHKVQSETISLNSIYDNYSIPLPTVLCSEEKLNPLNSMIKKENKKETMELFQSNLSTLEYRIISLLLNGYSNKDIIKILKLNNKQLYNAVARIKKKIKTG